MSELAIFIFVAVTVVFVLLYNSMIAKRNQVDHAAGSVSTYLKKRADLLPNLVASVQQYAKHESTLLTDLTARRTGGMASAGNMSDMMKGDAEVSRLLGRLSVVVENYPDLKANQSFLHLQQSLHEIEEQLSAARRTYNANVVRYNDAVQMIPTNIVANLLGYRKMPLYIVDEATAERPDVHELFRSAV